jgi:hypothetical protein
MRIELRQDRYHVWAPPAESWSPQSQPGYAASGDVEYLPVAELHKITSGSSEAPSGRSVKVRTREAAGYVVALED